MPLRVRCPECKTVMDVPTGSRPTCKACGFAGRGGTAAAMSWDREAKPVQWEESVPEQGAAQRVAAPGWPEEPPESEAWGEPAQEGWGEPPAEGWPEPEVEDPKAKRRR